VKKLATFVSRSRARADNRAVQAVISSTAVAPCATTFSTHAGVEPQCGLLLDSLPARFGVTLIKLALQESLEVRHLELFEHVPVARHDTTDAG
jgi:hypothetical protein